jgi:hypothetical protein
MELEDQVIVSMEAQTAKEKPSLKKIAALE